MPFPVVLVKVGMAPPPGCVAVAEGREVADGVREAPGVKVAVGARVGVDTTVDTCVGATVGVDDAIEVCVAVEVASAGTGVRVGPIDSVVAVLVGAVVGESWGDGETLGIKVAVHVGGRGVAVDDSTEPGMAVGDVWLVGTAGSGVELASPEL